MTASSLESIITKIKALRALATSSNVHEAAAAAAQAEALLQKHRLDEAALEANSAPTESPSEESEPLAWHTQHLSWWRVALGAALLKAHGCVGYVDTRAGRRCQVIVGRPSDVATVRYLYAWLTAEVSRLSEVHGRGRGRSWRNSFCLGAVTAIRDAMKAATVEAHRDATSSALAVLDGRVEESKSLLAKLQPHLRQTRGGSASDRGAFAQGVEAGRAIHLGGALSRSGAAPARGMGGRS